MGSSIAFDGELNKFYKPFWNTSLPLYWLFYLTLSPPTILSVPSLFFFFSPQWIFLSTTQLLRLTSLMESKSGQLICFIWPGTEFAVGKDRWKRTSTINSLNGRIIQPKCLPSLKIGCEQRWKRSMKCIFTKKLLESWRTPWTRQIDRAAMQVEEG